MRRSKKNKEEVTEVVETPVEVVETANETVVETPVEEVKETVVESKDLDKEKQEKIEKDLRVVKRKVESLQDFLY